MCCNTNTAPLVQNSSPLWENKTTTTTEKKKKTVSFSSSSTDHDDDTPQVRIVTVERIDLDFYTAADFRRFRQELVEEQEHAQRQAWKEKRQRGYNKLMARHHQRRKNTSTTTTSSSASSSSTTPCSTSSRVVRETAFQSIIHLPQQEAQ